MEMTGTAPPLLTPLKLNLDEEPLPPPPSVAEIIPYFHQHGERIIDMYICNSPKPSQFCCEALGGTNLGRASCPACCPLKGQAVPVCEKQRIVLLAFWAHPS